MFSEMKKKEHRSFLESELDNIKKEIYEMQLKSNPLAPNVSDTANDYYEKIDNKIKSLFCVKHGSEYIDTNEYFEEYKDSIGHIYDSLNYFEKIRKYDDNTIFSREIIRDFDEFHPNCIINYKSVVRNLKKIYELFKLDKTTLREDWYKVNSFIPSGQIKYYEQFALAAGRNDIRTMYQMIINFIDNEYVPKSERLNFMENVLFKNMIMQTMRLAETLSDL